MISTTTDLIDALGGNHEVAALLRVKHNTVSGWRERGLSAWAKVELQSLARARRLNVDDALFAISRGKWAA